MTEFLESDNGCFLYGGVFATTNDVERLLFAAVILRDLETMAELMRTTNGVTIDLNSRDDEGHTCLGIACKSGHLPTIKLLLQNGADINRSDFYGLTPLQYATEYGQVDTVRLLINEGADVNYIEERLSALHIAAGKGHIDITKLLIQAKCNVNILTRKGIAPLHYAVANGHREVIKLLLAASASVNVKGYKERTPIYMAGEAGDVELARVLIRVGAKLNTKDYYEMTPLNVVCNRNNTEVAKLFINQGSRVNVPDRTGSLPIHYVARNGNTEVLQLLLEAGSEVDRLNNHSESPLHLAVRMHHVDIVRKLVEVGCSANNYDPENPVGVSPLYAAVSVYTDPAEFEVVLGLLISAHCLLNAHIESTSATPLYRALDLGKVGIASVLLRHGADPYVTCPHDTTILSKACQRDMTSIAEMVVTSTHRWRSEPWLASSFNTTCLSSRNLGRFGEVPEDVPMVFWHKQTFYRRIQEIMTNVMPLMGCCRLVIRESLSDRLQEKINQLFLPNSLKGYLMMK